MSHHTCTRSCVELTLWYCGGCRYLDLSNNDLTGFVRAGLCDMPFLQYVYRDAVAESRTVRCFVSDAYASAVLAECLSSALIA